MKYVFWLSCFFWWGMDFYLLVLKKTACIEWRKEKANLL